MNLFLSILVGLLCILFIYQDFKHRKVNVYALILLFLTLGYTGYLELNTSIFPLIGINLLILSFLLLSLVIYYSIKKKKIYNIIDKEFGLGDVVFLLTIIPFFSFTNFLYFVITSVFMSFIYLLLSGNKVIPFAGIMAILLLFLIGLKQFKFVENYYFEKTILELFQS